MPVDQKEVVKILWEESKNVFRYQPAMFLLFRDDLFKIERTFPASSLVFPLLIRSVDPHGKSAKVKRLYLFIKQV